MRCKYVENKLDRYIQGDLTGLDKESIERHVSNCQSCADSLSRVRKMEALLEDIPLSPVPECFSERLMQRAYEKQAMRHASESKNIRIWEWLDIADLKKAVAAAIIMGLSLGLFMGLQTSRQSYNSQIVAGSGFVDAYYFDSLAGAPENSLSSVYMQMVSSGNNFKE